MAKTRFSGPVYSDNGFVSEPSTAAILADKTDPINTLNKVAGKQVTDLSDGIIYTATGSADTSAWKGSDGVASITPA